MVIFESIMDLRAHQQVMFWLQKFIEFSKSRGGWKFIAKKKIKRAKLNMEVQAKSTDFFWKRPKNIVKITNLMFASCLSQVIEIFMAVFCAKIR